MKKILLFSLSLITLVSCETTPTEGCTDPLAVNYNSQANINNNTCEFKADILFYLNDNAAADLYNNGVNKLTFYINEYNIGSQHNNNGFLTASEQDPPDCSNSLYTTGSFYWENNSSTVIDLEARDESDNVWFSEPTQLFANECLTVGITSKKLKIHQENN